MMPEIYSGNLNAPLHDKKHKVTKGWNWCSSEMIWLVDESYAYASYTACDGTLKWNAAYIYGVAFCFTHNVHNASFILTRNDAECASCWEYILIKKIFQSHLSYTSGIPARYLSRAIQWVYSFINVFILKIYSHWISCIARDEHRASVPEPL